MAENAWHQAYVTLLDTLRAAQKDRHHRSDFVTDLDGTPELGWVLYERACMLEAVNELRAKADANPVALEALMAAETSACGHSDYTSKFAIRCADLVVA